MVPHRCRAEADQFAIEIGRHRKVSRRSCRAGRLARLENPASRRVLEEGHFSLACSASHAARALVMSTSTSFGSTISFSTSPTSAWNCSCHIRSWWTGPIMLAQYRIVDPAFMLPDLDMLEKAYRHALCIRWPLHGRSRTPVYQPLWSVRSVNWTGPRGISPSILRIRRHPIGANAGAAKLWAEA